MDERPVLDPVDDTVQPAWGLWAFLVRLVMLAFGLLQIGLVLRIVLLLLGADQANTIVGDIINITNPFIDPFKGMFSFNTIATAGSVLDLAAVVALIGWTIAEAIVLAVLNLFR
jgi:hypothetical protein